MKMLTVIVNYCTAPHVLNALTALVPQLRELGDSAVWVVDNNSPDHSASVLRAAFVDRGYGPEVRLLESPVNAGFGAGNNVAIREALALQSPPNYLYLLNPDAEPDPGAMAALVDFLDREPRAAIAGTAVHDPDGTPHASAFVFPSLTGEFEDALSFGPMARLLRDQRFALEKLTESRPVDWVSGASMAIRREVLEHIGLFDEAFFLYYEEVDLCQRARQAGYASWFVREASVSHIGSVVTGVTGQSRTPSFWFDSRARYWRKHHGAHTLWAANALCLAGLAGLRTRRLLLGKGLGGRPKFARDLMRHSLSKNGRA